MSVSPKDCHNSRPARNSAAGIDGFVIVDKPAGVSSARSVSQLKRLLGVAKIGHAGTLDPFATGVLVCGVNQATRLMRFLLHEPKTYHAVLHLGIETDTLDRTGKTVAETQNVSVAEDKIHRTFQGFVGTIWQTPPVYSALKHQGVPLYRYARKGRPIQKPDRQVTVYDLTIHRIQLPRITFVVSCSAGTYIRSLCADIGRKLKCGGHLSELRRLACSGFTIDEACKLDALTDLTQRQQVTGRMVPMADGLRGLPQLTVDDTLKKRICQGQPAMSAGLTERAADMDSGLIKITDRRNLLLAVVHYDSETNKIAYRCVFPQSTR